MSNKLSPIAKELLGDDAQAYLSEKSKNPESAFVKMVDGVISLTETKCAGYQNEMAELKGKIGASYFASTEFKNKMYAATMAVVTSGKY
ncbi:hypothetical protein OYT40_002175 [Escherichia coli]|nr:hypothetical protein [Escherichia coli]